MMSETISVGTGASFGRGLGPRREWTSCRRGERLHCMSIVSDRSVKEKERKKIYWGAASLAAFGGVKIPEGWRQSLGLCKELE